jgi:hypothetical protein
LSGWHYFELCIFFIEANIKFIVTGIFLFFVAGNGLLYSAFKQRLIHSQQHKEFIMLRAFSQVNKLQVTLQLIQDAQKDKLIRVGKFNKVKRAFTTEMDAYLEKIWIKRSIIAYQLQIELNIKKLTENFFYLT